MLEDDLEVVEVAPVKFSLQAPTIRATSLLQSFTLKHLKLEMGQNSKSENV